MSKKLNTFSLQPKAVDAIRDLAIKLELDDLEVSQNLMSIAHEARPSGEFIKFKLEEYNRKISEKAEKSEAELKKLIASGEVAIIPIGFRCHTKMNISDSLGVYQTSLPFDSGFFPPSAVVSILNNPKVALNFSDNGLTHSVCTKHEDDVDSDFGRGIAFKTSSYDEINSIVTDKEIVNINRYLDSTFGYYTLDVNHKFVLAHYNWHKFAQKSKSQGVTDPKLNLQKINDSLNKRIERMYDLCRAAKYIFFIYGEYQNYAYMKINDQYSDLKDLSGIKSAVDNKFKAQSFVGSSAEFDSPHKILDAIKSLNSNQC